MRKRWVQHPETLELIPADEYQRPPPESLHIMPDIKPFKTVCGDIAGQEITSRSQLREFEKRNNLVQIGGDKSFYDKPDPKEQDRKHRDSVLHDLYSVARNMNG